MGAHRSLQCAWLVSSVAPSLCGRCARAGSPARHRRPTRSPSQSGAPCSRLESRASVAMTKDSRFNIQAVAQECAGVTICWSPTKVRAARGVQLQAPRWAAGRSVSVSPKFCSYPELCVACQGELRLADESDGLRGALVAGWRAAKHKYYCTHMFDVMSRTESCSAKASLDFVTAFQYPSAKVHPVASMSSVRKSDVIKSRRVVSANRLRHAE